MIESIQSDGKTIAIIIRADYRKDGIEFFTPDEFSQQLAYMNRPKGYQIEPHYHNPLPRKVEYTQEVLFIRSGKVRVDLFDAEQVFLKSVVLRERDVILLASGGHGFQMLEESEMIEVKQGPYAGENEKTRFKGVVPAENGEM